MNFNAVILILAGIARITEKLVQRSQRRIIWNPNFNDLSDPSYGARGGGGGGGGELPYKKGGVLVVPFRG